MLQAFIADQAFKSEFIGGCDIIKEMFEKAELQKLFEDKGVEFKK